MHDDERRSQSLLRELLTAEIRRAPDAAFEALAEQQRRLHELELTASKPDSHGRAGHRVARLTHSDAGRSAEPSEGDDPATSEQLLARLEENPEPEALAVCLRSLWHDHGALEECLPLLVRRRPFTAPRWRGKTSVSGPGQYCRASARAASENTARRSAAASEATWTISGLKLGRPLAA